MLAVSSRQVGLVPLIMTSHYRRYGCYANARTVFDIHNMVDDLHLIYT